MTENAGEEGGSNNLNLAALWLPVMAETSHIATQMREAGRTGRREFMEGFSEGSGAEFDGLSSAFTSSFRSKMSEVFDDPELPFGAGKFISNFTRSIDENVVNRLRGQAKSLFEEYTGATNEATEATERLNAATAKLSAARETGVGAATVIPLMQEQTAAQEAQTAATARAEESLGKYNARMGELSEANAMTVSGSEAMAGVLAGGVAFGMMFAANAVDELKDEMEEFAKEAIQEVIEVGDRFEDFEHQLELYTTASGEHLESLNESVTKVFSELDTTGDQLGTTMAVFAQRMGLSGEALERLSYHVTELQDRFGDFDVDRLQAAMPIMGVAPEKADESLASLAQTARQSATPINDLVNSISSAGTVLSAAGLDFNQAGAFAGDLSARGLNVQQAMTGLGYAEKEFAKDNLTFSDGLKLAAQKIKDLCDSGDTASADSLAEKLFGQRRWTEALSTVNSLLEVMNSAPGTFDATTDSLDNLIDKTRDWHDVVQETKNRIETDLKPLGLEFASVLQDVMDQILGAVDRNGDVITADVKSIGDGFLDALPAIKTFVAGAVDLLGVFLEAAKPWAAETVEFISEVERAIGWVTFNKTLRDSADDLRHMADAIDSADIAGKFRDIGDKISAIDINVPGLRDHFDSLFDDGKQKAGDTADAVKGLNDALEATKGKLVLQP